MTSNITCFLIQKYCKYFLYLFLMLQSYISNTISNLCISFQVKPHLLIHLPFHIFPDLLLILFIQHYFVDLTTQESKPKKPQSSYYQAVPYSESPILIIFLYCSFIFQRISQQTSQIKFFSHENKTSGNAQIFKRRDYYFSFELLFEAQICLFKNNQ